MKPTCHLPLLNHVISVISFSQSQYPHAPLLFPAQSLLTIRLLNFSLANLNDAHVNIYQSNSVMLLMVKIILGVSLDLYYC